MNLLVMTYDFIIITLQIYSRIILTLFSYDYCHNIVTLFFFFFFASLSLILHCKYPTWKSEVHTNIVKIVCN